MNKKQIIICLIFISLISFGFKLSVVDFSIPVNSDNLEYTLFAIAHTNGDFSQSIQRGMGWSLFTSTFFHFINSDDFFDYSNTIRTLSMMIGISSIPVMYLVGRKFFDHRYSLVLASFFAFEPHLNYNSTLGLAEPLFILATIGAFYFILNHNTRFIIISLILAGIAYWVRINGVWVFVVISIIYFITKRKSWKLVANFSMAFVAFILVISPIMIERNDSFGDPFYSVYKDAIFAGNYELMLNAIEDNKKISLYDYIEENGIFSFINNYFVTGLYNTLAVTASMTLPYLAVFIPFGILFSFRAFDQKSNLIKSNWIFILTSIGLLTFVMAIVPDRRFVLYLLPFFMIFSVIPLQRVVEYGLSTFSFSRKQKDIFLIGVIITIVILSSIVIIRFAPDSEYESEKLEFGKFVLNNLDGVTLRDSEGSLDYIQYLLVAESFHDYKIDSSIIDNADTLYQSTIGPNGKTIEELIKSGKNYNLKYIISNETPGLLHSVKDTLYYDYEEYPYLMKIFDSDDFGFNKLKIKVFEIDYEKFNKLLNE